VSTPLEQFIYAALVADPGVQAALGEDLNGHVALYLAQLPPGLTDSYYPAATYQRISTVPIYTHSQDAGTANGSAGWTRFQFTVWAKAATSGAQTDAAARAILNVLASFNGQNAGLPNAPNFLMSRRMLVEPQVDPPLFKAELDVRIWYQDQ